MEVIPRKHGYHRHHIVPKHAGGTDDDDNIVYLTPAEHAQAHLELYEKYGRYEDAQAFNTLSAQWLNGRTISGYKQSDEHIKSRISKIDYKKVSSKLKGRISPTKGMKFIFTEERCKNISKALVGRKLSEESKNKIANTLRGRISPKRIELYCIYCHKRLVPSRYDRHGPNKRGCTL